MHSILTKHFCLCNISLEIGQYNSSATKIYCTNVHSYVELQYYKERYLKAMFIVEQRKARAIVHYGTSHNYYLIQNSQAVKKVCGPQKGYGEKRCEIQGGGQEMAVMVG